MLHRLLFHWLETLFGPHEVDRFASSLNKQTLHFNSHWADLGSEGDAFSAADWPLVNNWANPPWSALDRLALFLEALPVVHVTLILPTWVGRPWYRWLQSFAWAHIPIPRGQDTFLPGRTGHLPMGLLRWQVEALRIDRPTLLPKAVPRMASQVWQREVRAQHLQWLRPLCHPPTP